MCGRCVLYDIDLLDDFFGSTRLWEGRFWIGNALRRGKMKEGESWAPWRGEYQNNIFLGRR